MKLEDNAIGMREPHRNPDNEECLHAKKSNPLAVALL